MSYNPVIGKLKRDAKTGEMLRLGDFYEKDLIAGVVRSAEENQQRIGKAITKRKLDGQKKLLIDTAMDWFTLPPEHRTKERLQKMMQEAHHVAKKSQ